MVMIAHHGIGTKFDTEERGQYPYPVFDPAAAVLVALTGVLIDTAEKSLPYTARRDVLVGRVGQAHQMFTGSGHAENGTGLTLASQGKKLAGFG